ncbi:MAG TPA: 3'-5' exonuclease, partial [Solibacillus sp.]
TTAVLTKLNARYEEAIGRALNGMRDAEKRRHTVTKLIDERDERIPKIKQEAKTTATRYMKPFTKAKVKTLYREIVTNRELLYEIAPEWDQNETESFLQAHKKEIWALEDLAALYYLQAKVKGIEEPWKMRVVFIDEVQDYSYFQLAALKAGLETDMFTMVGDLAQGIHSYRSLTDWQPVLDLFPRATYATLQKSYRTTIEIMEVANDILMQMDEDLPLVEPVVRHGKQPQFIEQQALNVKTITQIVEQIKASNHQSIALICKTTKEAKSIVKQLEKAEFPAQILDENSAINQQKLLVVPSHLAKGLEFDAVIIASFEAPYYDNPIDRKLLYVALTRAMHELYIVGPSKEAFLM